MTARVAVIGAGLVGASAALGLGRQGYEVYLVEPSEPKHQKGKLGIDLRNVALTPASRSFLEELGCWPDDHLAAYQKMYVWEQWGSGHIEFDASDMGLVDMGWVVEVSPLAVALWEQCARHPHIELVMSSITQVRPSDTEVVLGTQHDQELRVDFVIGADGARSTLRNLLGGGVQSWPVDQFALATAVRHEYPHQHIARQRFGVDGPLALLPSRDDYVCSVVWSQSEEAAGQRQEMNEEDFCAEIGRHSEHCLGKVAAVDQRIVFPLTQQSAERVLPHPRVLLVGDAMRVVHPLAGLGVNLGFEDVSQMLKVTVGQADLAAHGLWGRYVRHRQTRARAMIATMAGFKQIFGLDLPGAGLVRRLGMQAVSVIPGLKQQIMREAMGLGHLH